LALYPFSLSFLALEIEIDPSNALGLGFEVCLFLDIGLRRSLEEAILFQTFVPYQTLAPHEGSFQFPALLGFAVDCCQTSVMAGQSILGTLLFGPHALGAHYCQAIEHFLHPP
jgi:hypothetical protein